MILGRQTLAGISIISKLPSPFGGSHSKLSPVLLLISITTFLSTGLEAAAISYNDNPVCVIRYGRIYVFGSKPTPSGNPVAAC